MSGQVFHAPFLYTLKEFDWKYVWERSNKKAREKYPEVQSFDSWEQLLEAADLELVVINTPNALHFPMAKQALEKGKHVVVEKPFTLSVSEAEELLLLAKRKNRIISVFHNKRLEGEFKTVQELLKSEKLGKLLSFETRFDRFRPEIGNKKWKENEVPGAGLLYDLGPHLIDQVLQLFGLPEKISARLEKQRPQTQVIDFFEIQFHYAHCHAIAKAGMLEQPPFLKYKIEAEKGCFLKSGSDPQEELLKQGILPVGPDWGKEDEPQWGTIQWKNGRQEKVPTLQGTYSDFYLNVFQQIRLQAGYDTSQSGLDCVRIIECALQSEASGAPVLV